MTSEMTGAELQRATWGVIWGGIRFQSYGNGGGFWHRGKCDKQARNSSCSCGGSWNLLPIESDNGVALNELAKFCERRGMSWSVGWTASQDKRFCHIWVQPLHNDAIVDGNGETPAIAICRAIISTEARP